MNSKIPIVLANVVATFLAIGCAVRNWPSESSDLTAANAAALPTAERYFQDDLHITFDPKTSEASVGASVIVLGGSTPTAYLTWLVDPGLAPVKASVNDAPAATYVQDNDNYRFLSIVPAVPLLPGFAATVKVLLKGKLACPVGAVGLSNCNVAPDGMSRLGPGSVFPTYLSNPPVFHRGTRQITMVTPSGKDVVVSATLEQDTDDGHSRTVGSPGTELEFAL